MTTVAEVKVQADHLERRAKASPVAAVAELIWNGLDAEAKTIVVHLERSAMGALDRVVVEDDGHGMRFVEAVELFERLGGSWKQERRLSRNGLRRLHGKTGEGRFKAFAIGHRVVWRSVVAVDGELHATVVRAQRDRIGLFELEEDNLRDDDVVGTSVRIETIEPGSSNALQDEDAVAVLTAEFGLYVRTYLPTIRFDATTIDPTALQVTSADYPLEIGGIPQPDTRVTVIEWAKEAKVTRELVLCQEGGIAVWHMAPGIQAPGFIFTAYITSPQFAALEQGDFELAELNPVIGPIITAGKDGLREHFRRREQERASEVVDQWKRDQVYPFAGEATTPIERVERDVFDVVALNVNRVVPRFPELDRKAKQLSFALLRQAIAENPGSLRRILADVLDLPREQQDELAALLERTSLSAVISLGKLAGDRLDFLRALELLVFDPESKKQLKERSQLHRILANGETWVFGEEYSIAVDDQSLTEVLRKHVGLLGRSDLAVDVTDEVLREDGRRGIVDLMLSRSIPTHRGREHLVVELKRPSVEVGMEELQQVYSYAEAVASDERFRSVEDVSWDFWVTSNDAASSVVRLTEQADRPAGLYFEAKDRPLRVWVKTWGQVLEHARRRLQFLQDGLAGYASSPELALTYLRQVHEAYLPPVLRAKAADREV